jgi:hypothetical protein
MVADNRKLLASLKPVAGRANTFLADAGVFRQAGAEPLSVTLEPLYKVSDHRYVVYFDQMTPAEFAEQEEKARASAAAEAALAARTVDFVAPGQEQLERDHALRGERDSTGPFNDRAYRHAAGGWFSWEFKVLPNQPQELAVTYWGSDSNRTFDVLVNGEKLATETLANQHPGSFFDKLYPLPAPLLTDKEKITVRFQAVGDSTAGGVFGVRVLRSTSTGRMP